MDVILTEVLQGLRSDREAQLVERHLRAFPSFASKASTTSSLPPTSTGPRGTRESRSARRSTASSPLRASGRTPRCCTPTTTSTASPPAPRCGSGNPSSEPDPSPRAQKARGCGPSVGDTGPERPANRRLSTPGYAPGVAPRVRAALASTSASVAAREPRRLRRIECAHAANVMARGQH